jgi:hypothetical protein
MKAALLIPHVLTGLGIAVHGAQRLFGGFGGGHVEGSGDYGKSSKELGLF